MSNIPEEFNFTLSPCHVCGRKFRSDILNRHQEVCSKLAKKKRKVFDSEKMRISGTDIPVHYNPKNKNAQAYTKSEQKKKNWRVKHDELINAIRSARSYEISKATGAPLPPPPPPVIDPSFVQCDYCGRRFNEKAAERHIPFCKEKQMRLPSKPPQVLRIARPAMPTKKNEREVSSGYGQKSRIPGPESQPKGDYKVNLVSSPLFLC
ncbi:zinc finger, C2HC-type containing 1B [Cichlidogyrus casuarinus]|uniref:Zinc finger, C2HC-type containing 1B n=1 Tax=Cichlidogyrus casuarinus TaxID=1844966 RepID=A0ABD2PWL5_9PLAT